MFKTMARRKPLRQAMTQEMQLVCECCEQPYSPNKSFEDRSDATVFGTEKYALCPRCTQAVPADVLTDRGYRLRCERHAAAMEHLKIKAEAGPRANQIRDLTFKVAAKGGVSVYGLNRLPVTFYYEQWMRLLDSHTSLCAFLETHKARLKRKEK
jgi:hypothetical protein